jgi:hypothetical protein
MLFYQFLTMANSQLSSNIGDTFGFSVKTIFSAKFPEDSAAAEAKRQKGTDL